MGTDITSRNNVKRFGNGSQTIMFAHGYGCDQNMWRFITPAFEENYDIILFDHVGSGDSDDEAYDFDKYSSLKGYADDVIEICEALNLDEVIFVGHSVSTMIGVLAVGERPDLFQQLIMIGPSPRYINDEDYYGGFEKEDIEGLVETLESNYLGWTRNITPVIAGKSNDEKFAEELKNSFCRMDPDIAKHFGKVTFLSDNCDDLSNVSIPSLVIQSEPDVIAPSRVGKYVQTEIPNCSFTKLDATGHCPHLTAPDETIKAIKTYLAKG
ncbi:alpha/beta fold hydrolase [Fodinibius halophilus]|uniref:Alpha/beta hydrolase n=1 Tax=Fodinibius halophilus TaxID=1736908 RepID=A0A6M1TIM0_9BACT|nr:alpha/beta hydrolase [Fodinibius halophilus]NGP88450.1 alpha/beta hydrolase [Fodinibius halophilus]